MILTDDQLLAELHVSVARGALTPRGAASEFARFGPLFPIDIGDRPAPSSTTITVLGYAVLAERGDL